MTSVERARRRVASALRDAGTAGELMNALQRSLAAYVRMDRWCALTFDPATTLPTGGVHDHGVRVQSMPRLLELEFAGDDAIPFAALARGRHAVATLSEATHGAPESSARYRDVLAPEGLRHELRAVFGDDAGAWAGIVLLRGTDERDFSAEERAIVAGVSTDVCRALRRLLLSAALRRGHAAGPGLLILAARPGGWALAHANDAARRWLAEIDDGRAHQVPYALYSLAVRAQGEGHARLRLRTASGRWITAHAEAMGADSVSLILEPSRPHEVARVLAAAYGLTPRESQVVRLVAAGYANAEIARALGVSRYTVEDHLRHVYDKLSVKTRAALIARLFFDQYLPRAGAALSTDGWFAE